MILVLGRGAAAMAIGATLLGAARGSCADATPVRVTDLLKLRTIPAIDVSRDGRRAVFVVRSISPDSWQGDEVRHEYRSNIWSIDLVEDGAAPRQLTVGDSIDTSPILSPDGRRVAFVRAPAAAQAAPSTSPPTTGGGAGSAGAAQVWVLPLDGGEARPVTALPEGASHPAWSPDGKFIVVVSPVPLGQIEGTPTWPLDRPGRAWNDEPFTGTADSPVAGAASPDGDRSQQRTWLARNAAANDPTVVTRPEFVDDTSLRTRLLVDQLFLVEVDQPEAPARRLTRDAAHHREPVFIGGAASGAGGRGGPRIVYTAFRGGAEHLDRTLASELWTIGMDGRDDEPFLAKPGWAFEDAKPSPDGTLVGFRARQVDEPAVRPVLVGFVPVERGDPTFVTESIDRSVAQWFWNSANSGLCFVVADRGGLPLLSITTGLLAPLDIARFAERSPTGAGTTPGAAGASSIAGSGQGSGAAPATGTDGSKGPAHGQPVSVYAAASGGGRIVYALSTAQRPCVLVRRDAHGERELIDLNEWTRRRSLSSPQERWIVRPDGVRVQAFVMEPVDRRPGRTHPLLLAIHGGPMGMWGPGELTMWHEFQWLCGRGYGVVYCNPRGSNGYGFDFARLIRGDWGAGPSGDVLAALDDACTLDWVDRERLVIGGGSYGGFLTAYMLTRDQRFKAAVAERGVYDLATFFGEGSAWRLVEWYFGGYPFDPRLRDAMVRESPFYEARRIRTPLLIMHGSSDLRTGFVQSEMLYRALRVLGRPVEYVRYPGADHDMSRRGPVRQRIDRMVRTVEFFERFIGDPVRP
ncbi:MAG: prolyl oligopeptidase family serine peptidase [Phycisphaerales bacterium]